MNLSQTTPRNTLTPLVPLHHPTQERAALLEHLEKRPDMPWKGGGFFSFRNDSRVYGSPMFDAVYAEEVRGSFWALTFSPTFGFIWPFSWPL